MNWPVRTETKWAQRGFSLIEQIMVLAIVAILISVATPPLHHLLARNQVQVAQMDFIGALRYARAAAVSSGQPVVLCPTYDAQRCSGEMRWDHGWLLGHDSNRDNQPDRQPLHTGAGYSDNLRVYSSTGRRAVHFQPDGSARGSNLTLLFCEPGQAKRVLSVVVSNSGRVRGAPATPEQSATCTQMETTQ